MPTMKQTSFVLLPLLVFFNMPAQGSENRVELTSEQSAKLSKLIKGRTMGKPVRCLFRQHTTDMVVISENILIFGSSKNAKTIYLNRTSNACQGIANHKIVFSKTSAAKTCKGDTGVIVDSNNGAPRGSCKLNAFVPMKLSNK